MVGNVAHHCRFPPHRSNILILNILIIASAFVFDANGYLGKEIAKYLARAGYRATGLVRSDAKG